MVTKFDDLKYGYFFLNLEYFTGVSLSSPSRYLNWFKFENLLAALVKVDSLSVLRYISRGK